MTFENVVEIIVQTGIENSKMCIEKFHLKKIKNGGTSCIYFKVHEKSDNGIRNRRELCADVLPYLVSSSHLIDQVHSTK